MSAEQWRAYTDPIDGWGKDLAIFTGLVVVALVGSVCAWALRRGPRDA